MKRPRRTWRIHEPLGRRGRWRYWAWLALAGTLGWLLLQRWLHRDLGWSDLLFSLFNGCLWAYPFSLPLEFLGRPFARATPDGLVVRDASNGWRTVPWSAIREVDWCGSLCRIHHDGGVIEVPENVYHAGELAAVAARRMVGASPAVAVGQPDLSLEAVEELLQCGAGGAVEWRGTDIRPVLGFALALPIVLLTAFGLISRHAWPPAIVAAAACIGAVPLMRKQRPIHLRADGDGLTDLTAAPIRHAWADVVELRWDTVATKPATHSWRLRTSRGDVWIEADERSAHVVAALQRVLAARDASGVRPRMGGVGDAAISPVREGEQRAERGISRSEGDVR
ncbi:MAG: hypothetical protein HYU66_05105 [Armatimonadetes bacterium]|nr:hypothetical protein [Armatimonadota bacterium]